MVRVISTAQLGPRAAPYLDRDVDGWCYEPAPVEQASEPRHNSHPSLAAIYDALPVEYSPDEFGDDATQPDSEEADLE